MAAMIVPNPPRVTNLAAMRATADSVGIDYFTFCDGLNNYFRIVAMQIVVHKKWNFNGFFHVQRLTRAVRAARAGINPRTRQPCVFRGRRAADKLGIRTGVKLTLPPHVPLPVAPPPAPLPIAPPPAPPAAAVPPLAAPALVVVPIDNDDLL